MGKVIRLTESELIRIIKKVIEEQRFNSNIPLAVDNTRTTIQKPTQKIDSKVFFWITYLCWAIACVLYIYNYRKERSK